jgi:hypothetical protein
MGRLGLTTMREVLVPKHQQKRGTTRATHGVMMTSKKIKGK